MDPVAILNPIITGLGTDVTSIAPAAVGVGLGVFALVKVVKWGKRLVSA